MKGIGRKILIFLSTAVGLFLIAVVGLAAYIKFIGPLPAEKVLPEHFFFLNPPHITFDGPGKLIVFTGHPERMPSGSGVVIKPPFKSEFVRGNREMIVYLPPDYPKQGVLYPLIMAFHGYMDCPQHMLATFLPSYQYAVSGKILKPSVVVFPDISIGGNGLDDPGTPDIDERIGTWMINSNHGRYEDFIIKEIVPYIRKNFQVDPSPQKTVFMGFSMGGYASVATVIRHPETALIAIGFAPVVDFRYSCGGSKLKKFDPGCYRPIDKDDPKRPFLIGAHIVTLRESVIINPIFDSDKIRGTVWDRDLPVFERLRESNPSDWLREKQYDLSDRVFYLVSGDHDNYNVQSHLPVFIPLAKKAGAIIAPENNIRPGYHSWQFVSEQMPEALEWLGKRI